MKQFKFFLISEFDREEVYLREMHKKGYELVHASLPGIYTFKECEPKDVVYRLDFNPLSLKDKLSYIQMFEDYGWNYLQDMNEFSYFRKEANLTNEKENEIFGDNESKLEMIKRITKRKLIPILVLYFCCFFPNLMNTINYGITPFTYLLILFAIFIIYIIIRVILGFNRLNIKFKVEK